MRSDPANGLRQDESDDPPSGPAGRSTTLPRSARIGLGRGFMTVEIERKFRVVSDGWRAGVVSSARIVDGLLSVDGPNKVRVRRCEDAAWLTVKGPRVGISRDEFEYPIPLVDADDLLARRCIGPLLAKTRHVVVIGPDQWTVDVHEGALAGLVTAEIELDREDRAFGLPDWIGEEITHDPRFGSAALSRVAAGEPDPGDKI